MPEGTTTLDARGRRCAMLSMTIAGEIARVAPGSLLEVLSDDPGAATEVPTWCRSTRNPLVSLDREGEGWRIVIRRGA